MMYKYSWVLLTLLIIINSISCKRINREGNNGNITIVANDSIEIVNITNTRTTDFDSIFTDIDYIVLEEGPLSFFERATILKIHESKIYIFDIFTNSILIFNRNGKFIKKVGRRGNGHGEYDTISSFAIDYNSGLLYVGDGPRLKILVFDLDGNFIRSFRTKYQIGYIAMQNNSHIIHESSLSTFGLNNNQTLNQEENIEILDLNGKRLFYGFNYDYNRNIELICDKMFQDKSNNVTFSPMFKDTIYSISNNIISPQYAITYNTQQREFQKKEFLEFESSADLYRAEANNHIFFLGRHIVSPDYIYLFLGASPIAHAFYSKKTGETLCFKKLSGGNAIFFDKILYYNDGFFYCVISNYNIDTFKNEGKLSNKAKQMLSEIGATYNPIIVKFKLKEF